MFKCKQCRYPFSANIPDQCPECGAATQKPTTDAKGVSILLTLEAISTIAVFVVIVFVFRWISGWF